MLRASLHLPGGVSLGRGIYLVGGVSFGIWIGSEGPLLQLHLLHLLMDRSTIRWVMLLTWLW